MINIGALKNDGELLIRSIQICQKHKTTLQQYTGGSQKKLAAARGRTSRTNAHMIPFKTHKAKMLPIMAGTLPAITRQSVEVESC